jgi:hypothetical protein
LPGMGKEFRSETFRNENYHLCMFFCSDRFSCQIFRTKIRKVEAESYSSECRVTSNGHEKIRSCG